MHLGGLPPEIHDYIADYVCSSETPAHSPYSCEDADPHYMEPSILALGRVSKYWSNICKPYKHVVIFVTVVPTSGDGRSSHLTDLLERLSALPHHERRVQHLQLRESSLSSNGASDLDFTSTIPRLIDLLAPTLRSLALSFPCSRYSTSLFTYTYSVAFPQLKYLSLNGFYPPPHSPASAMVVATTILTEGEGSTTVLGKPNFPVLEDLRLSGVRNPGGLFRSHSMQFIFPVLQRLEIGGVADAPGFSGEVSQMLSEHDDFTSRVGNFGRLSSYEDIYTLLSEEKFQPGIPITLKEFAITLRQNMISPQTVLLQRPTKYRADRHEKMVTTFKALENRSRKEDGSMHVEFKMVSGCLGSW